MQCLPSLTAIDPEIRDSLGNEKGSCKSSNIDVLKNRIEKASQIADSRGLVRDPVMMSNAMSIQCVNRPLQPVRKSRLETAR
jgi:hypothetical protein